MNRFRQTVSLALALTLVSLGLTAAQAQRRTYRLSDRQVGELIRRVETSTDRFRASLDSGLDRTRYDGTRAEDNINQFVQSFEQATDQLRSRFNARTSVASDVEYVLRQAVSIDSFMTRNRLPRRAQNDWAIVRSDLNALARAYNVVWRWDQPVATTDPGYGSQPTYGSQRAYRMTDQQVEAIIRRVENRTDVFRASLDRALDRTRYDGTRAEDNINLFVRDFETATDQLRSRFNSRRSVAGDVENVLRQATLIDDFMTRNRMTRRVEGDWALLKTDLNELASAYSVAWNWRVDSFPTTPGSPVYTSGGLTGTYRLDTARSDNARAVAERAAANLPFNERERVIENIMRRLEAPEMIAIERQGRSVTIASSRAAQTTFDADGTERREQLPNGGFSRVTASLTGEQLIVRSAGFRATDFNVTFEPTNGGRQLLVTREIWNDRLGQNPVVVRNLYERTSDVAQWNVFGGAQTFPGDTTSAGISGDFGIPNGQTVVATLNTDLTTQTSQVGDRFTMTVRDPAQYEGATIEGRVASVSRSGRVTGRSDLALDFDTIRMRDGRSYRFAGFIESVRTANGETVNVDNEGSVRDDNSRGTTTAQRAAIGTAVGALIGAIAGGGKGAAIGAVIGAGAGAGSVYVQGREDLSLLSGTELTIRSSSPTNR